MTQSHGPDSSGSSADDVRADEILQKKMMIRAAFERAAELSSGQAKIANSDSRKYNQVWSERLERSGERGVRWLLTGDAV